MAKKEKRFIKTYSYNGGLNDNYMAIYVDKQTGVNYLYSGSGYAGGLTVLLGSDGKPVITPLPITEEEGK